MSLYQRGMSLKALLEKPELLAPPRKQDEGKDKEESLEFDGNLFSGQSAFLGPQLWDKTITYDEADLKLEFMDLDEFLCENSLTEAGVEPQVSPSQHAPSLPPHSQLSPGQGAGMSQLGALLTQPQLSPGQLSPGQLSSGQLSPRQMSPGQMPAPQLSPRHTMMNPNTLQMSTQSPPANPQHPEPLAVSSDSSDSEGEDFDPRNRTFSAEELRPQPVIKKSRKVFVPDDLKDDKYWARRNKNNVAARRSRDARRTKENQIAMRALFLERQSDTLSVEVDKLTRENMELRRRLSKYEPDAATE